ncbi:MAG: RNA polymerase sigma factor [Gemmataceae bacterium]
MSEPQPDLLLRRCQRGDEAALGELIRLYQDRIFRLACRMLIDTALAEDAAAQVFVKLWSRASQWQEKSSAATWIYRLAVRTILDVQRGQQRWWRRIVGLSSVSEVAASKERESDDRVSRALLELNENDRALVHLYYFEERGLADIEAILNVPRETLKMRLARARQRLKAILEKEDDGGPPAP